MPIKGKIFKFNTFSSAKRFVDGAVKPLWVIIMGDDEKYWVVTMKDAALLIRAGYEEATC